MLILDKYDTEVLRSYTGIVKIQHRTTWQLKGNVHRVDGHAMEWVEDNYKEWWLLNDEITEEATIILVI